MFYLSPYNDEEVIAGQGTCGVEIVAQLPDVDTLFVAVGGGGLVGGVGSVLKTHDPDIMIYACQPLASPVMARSVEAGHIVDMPSDATLSDGTAGGIEPASMTFPICQAVVDEFVLVDESRIAAAMRLYMKHESETIEGAAGVAGAALLDLGPRLRGRKVVVIVCGGNISDDKLQEAIAGDVST